MERQIENIFKLTAQAFSQSEIREKANNEGKEWHYSLMATKIKVGNPLIIGFNLGAKKDEFYRPQHTIPTENLKELNEKGWLGSFNKVYNSLHDCFPTEDFDNYMMTNYCFFRSPNESDITYHDLNLCIPLFENLLQILKPSKIIGFSSKLRTHLMSNGNLLEKEMEKIPNGNSSVFVVTAKLKVNGDIIPLILLPHPNSRISGDARRKAWTYFKNSHHDK